MRCRLLVPLGPEYVRLKASMPTWKDVTTIGLALPKTEVSTWYGTPGMKVAAKPVDAAPEAAETPAKAAQNGQTGS